MRALLFLAGVALCGGCLFLAAVLLYNNRPGWWWLALIAIGFLPAVRLRT